MEPEPTCSGFGTATKVHQWQNQCKKHASQTFYELALFLIFQQA
jgi:hypothetical protein